MLARNTDYVVEIFVRLIFYSKCFREVAGKMIK